MKKLLLSLSLIVFSTLSIASKSNLDDLEGFPKDPASSYSFGTYYKKDAIDPYVRKSKTAYREVKEENLELSTTVDTLTKKLSQEEERTLRLDTAAKELAEKLSTEEELRLQLLKSSKKTTKALLEEKRRNETLALSVATNSTIGKHLELSNTSLEFFQKRSKILEEKLVSINGEKGDIEDILLAATHAVDNPLLALSEQTEKLSKKFSEKGSLLLEGIQTLQKEIEQKSASVLKLSTTLGEKEEKLKHLLLGEKQSTQEKENLEKEIEDLQSVIKKERKSTDNLGDQLRKRRLELQEAQRSSKKYQTLSEDSSPLRIIYKKMELDEEACSNFFLVSLIMSNRDHLTTETFKVLLKRLKSVSYCKTHFYTLEDAQDLFSQVRRDDTIYRLLTDYHIGLCNQKHTTSTLKIDVSVLNKEKDLLSGLLK